MKKIIGAVAALAALVVMGACNKTSLLGSELFEDDKLNLSYTDTLSLNALNEVPAQLKVSQGGYPVYTQLLLGKMDDPFLGETEAAIFANFLGTSAFLTDSVALDSIVLNLSYNAANFYGDTTETQTINVYRLAEAITGDTIYANQTFQRESTPLGSISFKPTPNTRYRNSNCTLTNTGVGACDSFPTPRVTITLNRGLFDLMRRDSATIKNDSLGGFLKWFKGLAIEVDGRTKSMMSFNFGTSATGIVVHYRKSSLDTARQIAIYTTNNCFNNFKHNYQTGVIKDFLGNPAAADSLMFVQGMNGPNALLEIPNLKALGNVVINKAILELTVNENTDAMAFPPINQIAATTAQFDPVLDMVLDNTYVDGLSTLSPYEFGGRVTTFQSAPLVRKYNINLTGHIQRMLKGLEGPSFYLTFIPKRPLGSVTYPDQKSTNASRVVLYGPKTQFRPRLKITYTKI